jgi:hypothetical protein
VHVRLLATSRVLSRARGGWGSEVSRSERPIEGLNVAIARRRRDSVHVPGRTCPWERWMSLEERRDRTADEDDPVAQIAESLGDPRDPV